MPEREPKSVTGDSSGTGWFVGIIVAIAILAIGYLVFSVNSRPTRDNAGYQETPSGTTCSAVEPQTRYVQSYDPRSQLYSWEPVEINVCTNWKKIHE